MEKNKLPFRRIALYSSASAGLNILGITVSTWLLYFHPLAALTWLAERLLRDGAMLREGDVVLTGGLTRAFAAQPGMRFSSQVGDPAQGGGEAALRFL